MSSAAPARPRATTRRGSRRTIADAAAVVIDHKSALLRVVTATNRTIRAVRVVPHGIDPTVAADRARIGDIAFYEQHLAALGLTAWGKVGEHPTRTTYAVLPTGRAAVTDVPLAALDVDVPFTVGGRVAEGRHLTAVEAADGTYELYRPVLAFSPWHPSEIVHDLPSARPSAAVATTGVHVDDIAQVARTRFGVQLVGSIIEWLVHERDNGTVSSRLSQASPGVAAVIDPPRTPRLRRCVTFRALPISSDTPGRDARQWVFDAKIVVNLPTGTQSVTVRPRSGPAALHVSVPAGSSAFPQIDCPDDGNLWAWVGAWVDMYCTSRGVTRIGDLVDLDQTINGGVFALAVTFRGAADALG